MQRGRGECKGSVKNPDFRPNVRVFLAAVWLKPTEQKPAGPHPENQTTEWAVFVKANIYYLYN